MFKKMIAKQFRRPSGLLAHYAANFMEKNNQEYYTNVIEMLDIVDDDSILEIGCGAGFALRKIAEKKIKCRIEGLDFSPFMIKRAQKNNREFIEKGRIRLYCQDIFLLRSTDKYSKIFAINVIYFWNDLDKIFSRIFGMLAEKGRFVVFMSSRERLNTIPFASDDVFHKYELDTIKERLRASGFPAVSHKTVFRNRRETFYIRADK